MESQYLVLAEAFQTTQTVDSFHLAEENKQEIPHDDVRYKIMLCVYMLHL